ncbi:MAG TPA: hypothetical protein V6C71_08320 [Coleofasciculaceae cyanobacterium]|jgi:transposase-like protein
MKCPNCQSLEIGKYGFKKQKQRYQCRKCGRIFQSIYSERGYCDDVKQICLKMYLNGLELRVFIIQRPINWVRKSGQELSEDDDEDVPQIAELDELQTYVGRKTNKIS